MKKETIPFQRLSLLAFVLSWTFLSFVLGTVVMSFKVKPLYTLFRDTYDAAQSWQEKLTSPTRYNNRYLFFKTRYPESGILRYDPKKAYTGYTLFTSAHDYQAFLMSMNGEIVHQWSVPFVKDSSNSQSSDSDEYGFLRKAHLYPNGDLLVIYENVNDNGYGMVKVDKDSQILWKYNDRVHHDIDVGSDGKIYTIVRETVKEKIPGIKESSSPWFKDSILVLSPQGKELKRVDLVKVFMNSDFPNALAFGDKGWDFFHTNGAEVLNKELASQFPLFKEGQVLVSLRAPSMIAVVDLEQEKAVWATRGIWYEQHDADFLDNGNLLLFDNQGNLGKGGRSRVIELDPQTQKIVWEYAGTEKEPFYSEVRSDQQRLPNGNTLITESDQGRLFEVTPDKKIVWEYSSPWRAPQDQQLVAIISWSQRIDPNNLKFQLSNPK